MEKKAANGGEALLELFDAQGTDHIFCAPLAVWAPLWEALAKRKETQGIEKPRYVNCRHEMLAVGLASGYYKITGNVPVVLLATDIGVLSGAMALRGAFQERVPMVVLAPTTFTHGEEPDRDPGPEWCRLIDLGGPVHMAENYIKWAFEVKTARDLVSNMHRAYYFANTVPRGPVLLSIPFDILLEPVPIGQLKGPMPYPTVTDTDILRQVATMLVKSQNPIIITDHGGRTHQEVATLVQLAEFLGAPVFETPMLPTYMNFPGSHPLHGEGYVEEVLGEADCILVAGSSAPWHPPLLPLKEGSNVIVLEEDPMRPRFPYWGYKTDFCVAGDVGMNLGRMVRVLKEEIKETPGADERFQRWQKYNDEKRNQWVKEAEAARDAKPINARWLFQTLNQVLPEGAIVVEEAIAQAGFTRQNLPRTQALTYFCGAAGGLGTGIPTAQGVKLGAPEKLAVCLIGDGSFSWNPVLACFGLSQQYQLPLLIIICNNQGYASQAWNVQKYFSEGSAVKTGNYYGTVIEPTPDYPAIARAFDGYGERVENPEDLKPALDRALKAVNGGKLALIDVILTP